MGLQNFFLTQGNKKIVFWMEEKDNNSLSRPKLQANYELALLHIGIGGDSLFNLDYSMFGILLPKN